ncbi:hypothetical protein LTR86_010653 [Recurvomyces mirabilis]|nr:hypothetical protein LTR86_010653 [Recurvomyces mirabilis]
MAAFGQLMQRLNAMHGSFTLKQQSILDLGIASAGHEAALAQTQQQLLDLERIAGEQSAALVQAKQDAEEAKAELAACEEEAKRLMQSYSASAPIPTPFQSQLEGSLASPTPPPKLHALDIQHNEYVASLEAAGHGVHQNASTIARTKIRVRSLPAIHDRYPMVVRMNGVWTEISCHYCGANATHGSKTFMKGIDGLNRHITSSHLTGVDPRQLYADTEDECIKRAVSNRDVSRMIVGQEPEDVKVVMVFTTAPARPRMPDIQIHDLALDFVADVVANNGSNGLPILASKRRASLAETMPVEGESEKNENSAHAAKRRRETCGGSSFMDLCGNDTA